MTTVNWPSPYGRALPIGYTPARSLPTSSIGPIICSYLTERPSELKVCGRPCPGPPWSRMSWASWGCRCDGNGFCLWSRDLGSFRTLRCTCMQNCLDKPVAKWRADAFTVLTVLTLRQSLRPPAAANIATVGTGEALARGYQQEEAASAFESVLAGQGSIVLPTYASQDASSQQASSQQAASLTAAATSSCQPLGMGGMGSRMWWSKWLGSKWIRNRRRWIVDQKAVGTFSIRGFQQNFAFSTTGFQPH